MFGRNQKPPRSNEERIAAARLRAQKRQGSREGEDQIAAEVVPSQPSDVDFSAPVKNQAAATKTESTASVGQAARDNVGPNPGSNTNLLDKDPSLDDNLEQPGQTVPVSGSGATEDLSNWDTQPPAVEPSVTEAPIPAVSSSEFTYSKSKSKSRSSKLNKPLSKQRAAITGRRSTSGNFKRSPSPKRSQLSRPQLSKQSRSAGSQRTRRRIAVLIGLVIIGIGLYVLNQVFQPFHGEGGAKVTVTIPKGAKAEQIADILAEKGVINSGFYFAINATLSGKRDRLQSGKFILRKDMSNDDAITALTQASSPKALKIVKVVIPEGKSIHETAAIVKKAGLKGDYVRATKDRAVIAEAHKLGLPRKQNNVEGFLYPNTYELEAGSSVLGLVKRQLASFKQNAGRVNMRFAHSKNLTTYEVIIIASMLEREASGSKDQGLIASVIYNRLRQGMYLGIDATTRYETKNWVRPLSNSDLKRESKYNTRNHLGLVPTPIGNPGAAAIKAAARPPKTDYLYFVVKPGTCDSHVFSSNSEQFNQDVARYKIARSKKNGKSPTNCRK